MDQKHKWGEKTCSKTYKIILLQRGLCEVIPDKLSKGDVAVKEHGLEPSEKLLCMTADKSM